MNQNKSKSALSMKKRILIVDDIEFNLELEEKIINTLQEEFKIDIEINKADTVKEALTNITQNDVYDAMIIDMNLPDGSGIDIAKAALKKSTKTRIAALTIYPNQYHDQENFFHLFWKKPIMPEPFKENLTHLLQLKQLLVSFNVTNR